MEDLTRITADIVSAYVSNNHVRTEEVAVLIKDVHGKLAALTNSKAEPPAAAKPEPRMPVKKTITPGYLISLEDGKPYKTLRRHLATRGLTPDEYRAKWGLPDDYPMVAKDYADRRSTLAKSIGLGQKRVKAEQGEAAAAIADDLVSVIAEDVIGDEGGAAGGPKAKAPPTGKAGRTVTPNPKPKDRSKATRVKKASGQQGRDPA